jgi:CRISPR-associated endoribonuclease Cas6
MRLYFKTSKNTEVIPYDYQYKLLGKFHKWLGNNKLHDSISLYSFGWLSGQTINKKGLFFPDGANWFISFWDNSIGKTIIDSIMKGSEFIYGMKVLDIVIQETPEFGTKKYFQVSSPVLIRDYDNGKAKFRFHHDKEADNLLTQTLKSKLKIADLSEEVSVKFDRDYYNPKTKLININGIDNRATLCPVVVEGNPEAIQFAWNVGIGHSTGSGFGALK